MRFTLADEWEHGARALLTGSAWGSGFFKQAHDLGLAGDPDYHAATWPTRLNPRLSRAWLEAEEGRLNALEKAAELDGLWTELGARYFPAELLESCVLDGVELPPLPRRGSNRPGPAPRSEP